MRRRGTESMVKRGSIMGGAIGHYSTRVRDERGCVMVSAIGQRSPRLVVVMGSRNVRDAGPACVFRVEDASGGRGDNINVIVYHRSSLRLLSIRVRLMITGEGGRQFQISEHGDVLSEKGRRSG
jgi:hypothetical protein